MEKSQKQLLEKSNVFEEIEKGEIAKQKLVFLLAGCCGFFNQFLMLSLQKSFMEKIDPSRNVMTTFLVLSLFGALSDITNLRYLVLIKHLIKVYLTVFCNLISISLLLTATYFSSFYLYLFTLMIFGFSMTIQISTLLGFVKSFPLEVAKFLGIGIGFSSILVSLIVLSLSFLKKDFRFNFVLAVLLQLILIPTFR